PQPGQHDASSSHPTRAAVDHPSHNLALPSASSGLPTNDVPPFVHNSSPADSEHSRVSKKLTPIDEVLTFLRDKRISPMDILLKIIDPAETSYSQYRTNFYRNDGFKLSQFLGLVMDDASGNKQLLQFMKPYVESMACEIVAEQMNNRKEASLLTGIKVVDPDFIESWSMDEDEDTTPFLTTMLLAASQTPRAKKENKIKAPESMCSRSDSTLPLPVFESLSGLSGGAWLFLWSTGSARQTIDAFFRCALSVSYDSVLNSIKSLASHCVEQAVQVANEPHAFCYDNVNISTSIFVEQRGAAGPAKVTSALLRFKASKGLEFRRDILPSREHLVSFNDQLIVTIIKRMFALPAFESLAKDAELQYTARRAIPGDIELKGSLRVNQVGSLSYFFSVMEKVRLGNEQPDYHSLLAALEQILDGLILNAWMRECNSTSLDAFAKSKPTHEQLRDIASRILLDYATPVPPTHTKFEPKRKKPADSESSDSESSTPTDVEEEADPTEMEQPTDDIVHQNTRILTRDLLIVSALVRAISDGDIGRVEVMLPHLAMFRGSGCNKYCAEILHFIHNLKHVWTPEFAYGDFPLFFCQSLTV
ncbi:hypothetical protein FB45DRAFT_1129825, partial [Roridomyces roridus]